jgi:hypothetical protein
MADRTPAEQRELLVATIKFVGSWRAGKAAEAEKEFANEQSRRAALAISQLAGALGRNI